MAREAVPAGHPSQIEHQVVVRARAADEGAAVGGRLDRVGVVVDASRDQRALAVVADAGATRPANGYVARLGQLEQAPEVVVPRDREVAARELDRRAGPGLAGRWVGRA